MKNALSMIAIVAFALPVMAANKSECRFLSGEKKLRCEAVITKLNDEQVETCSKLKSVPVAALVCMEYTAQCEITQHDLNLTVDEILSGRNIYAAFAVSCD